MGVYPRNFSLSATAVLLIFCNLHHIASEYPDYACKAPRHSSYYFCDTSQPVSIRAQTLVDLLTLPEKIEQLSNNASGVPRLGIPAYQWWSESLHGVASNGPGVSFSGVVPSATSFPQVILSAASFNRSLWRSIASAISMEARAMYNLGQAGLTFWAPNINPFRDPRWGRGQETPGEDPAVASAYAIQYVRGFQGLDAPVHAPAEKKISHNTGGLMLSACCKHFIAYDLEKWGQFSRYNFNAIVTKQDLEDTYQLPFQSCIQDGGATCLMCSYNLLNGVPACASQLLQKARLDWGFSGYITSDCDAVATIYEYQKFSRTPEDAVSYVLKSGMDINCGTYLRRHTLSALQQGKVSEEHVNNALFNLFLVQFRLGLFDGDPRHGKFGNLGPESICSSEHRKLALEAAKQGIVLLKNNHKFLPLRKNVISSLAVIGPAVNDDQILTGNYAGVPCRITTFYEGLKAYVKKIYHASGCLDVPCISSSGFDEAVMIAKKADVAIVIVGLDLTQEAEDRDRVSLLLPGKQMELVSLLASTGNQPLILVLTGGGPLDVSFAKNDPRISSIVWIGYPGEAGGQALAEIIFGDANPGGRLPVTWYPESYTAIAMNDMNMRADPSRGYPGRTYKFYTGNTVYRFGHGLSFCDFKYNIISAPERVNVGRIIDHGISRKIRQRSIELDYIYVDEIESCDVLGFEVRISVRNGGDRDAEHSVLLFSSAAKERKGIPQKQLIGFERVRVGRSSNVVVSIMVNPCAHLSSADVEGRMIVPLGEHVLMVEDAQHEVSFQVDFSQE